MKAASIANIRKELKRKSNIELHELCLELSRFKKENKELLTYLLFEAESEQGYIQTIKQELDEQFKIINTDSFFYIKKSVRKILRNTKKYIRYSRNKETEVELLIHFCTKLKSIRPSIYKNITLKNIFNRNLESIKKKVLNLHEDLQYDLSIEIEELNDL